MPDDPDPRPRLPIRPSFMQAVNALDAKYDLPNTVPNWGNLKLGEKVGYPPGYVEEFRKLVAEYGMDKADSPHEVWYWQKHDLDAAYRQSLAELRARHGVLNPDRPGVVDVDIIDGKPRFPVSEDNAPYAYQEEASDLRERYRAALRRPEFLALDVKSFMDAPLIHLVTGSYNAKDQRRVYDTVYELANRALQLGLYDVPPPPPRDDLTPDRAWSYLLELHRCILRHVEPSAARQRSDVADGKAVTAPAESNRAEPDWSALESEFGAALMTHTDIAARCSVSDENLRKRLNRWRRDNPGEAGRGWVANGDRSSTAPAHIYRFGAVLSVVRDLWASGKASGTRPTPKKNTRETP